MSNIQTIFNFIHISDLHLSTEPYRVNFINKMNCVDFQKIHKQSIQNFKINTSFYPSSYDYQALSKFILFIKNNIEHDFVLLTGDISTTGMRKDLEQAYNTIDGEKLVIIKKQFTTSMAHLNNILLLPGNHDRYGSTAGRYRESTYRPGGVLFDQIFKKYWKNNKKIQFDLLSKDDIKILLLRVDFSLEENKRTAMTTMLGYAGRGKAYNSILSDIEKIVLEIREKHGDIPVLLANHFHPQKKGSLELRNADKFLLKMKTLNINYIFCGHTHEQNIAKLNNRLTIYCAGSLCGLPGKNAFIHHELKVTKDKGKYSIIIKSHLYQKYPNGTIDRYNTLIT